MNILLLLILGLSCGAYCRDCLHPAAMDNFTKKDFEGEWYSMAFSTPNKTEDAFYGNTKCSLNTFKLENDNLFSGFVSYFIGDIPINYTGQYVVQDPTRAKLKVKFSGYPIEYAYDIICTDYTNWAVTYACAQLDAGHSSEFLSLMGRDRTKHSELIHNERAKKCVQDQLQITIDTLRKTPQEQCSNHYT